MDKLLEDIEFELRGSSWFFITILYVRSAMRDSVEPFFRTDSIGFRVIKSASNKKQIKRWKDETEGGLFDG